MQSSKELHINWSVPNFVTICIEECKNGEFAGKLYHKYDKKPVGFAHFMEMVKWMEQLYDSIDYPQATCHKRSFLKEVKAEPEKKAERPVVWESQEFGGHRGALATFYVMVKGRANATWQGEVIWVEKEISKKFRSVMELMILMDNALK